MKEKSKLNVYIVGTHGVPARYGGFESLAEHLCRHLNQDFNIVVFCNARKYPERRDEFCGVKLRYIHIDASGLSGIFYDLFSYPKALRKGDVVLYLGVSGSGFIVPLRRFYRTKVIVNHGGLNEWEREKLSWIQRRWAKFNHRIAARSASLNIADNELYRESLRNNFGVESLVIKYGGDHVHKVEHPELAAKYPFVKEKYAINVSRAQIDNNLHMVLESFTKFNDYPLVLVSNWSVSKYGRELKKRYSGVANLILLDAIYDAEELNFLRGNAYVYVHSHSRSGTAPSLVEAMCLGRCVLSFDTEVNKETTEQKCLYFNSADELEDILKNLDRAEHDRIADDMLKLALDKYSWSTIVGQYKTAIESVASKTGRSGKANVVSRTR